jgi:ferredoxin
MSGFSITFNGYICKVRSGQTISEALMENGYINIGKSYDGSPRGVYCGMGACFQCRVILNGNMNIRACKTLAKPDDVVMPQNDETCGVE